MQNSTRLQFLDPVKYGSSRYLEPGYHEPGYLEPGL